MTPSKPDIILYGGPGSGKSTQAIQLVKKLRAQHLNMGALLRKVAKSPSAEGKKMKEITSQGRLAPVHVTNELAKKFIHRAGKNQIVFDGYPRDLRQMKFLEKFLEKSDRHSVMVFIKLPISIARDRLLKRAKIEHRIDDLDPKALTRRIQVFSEQSKKLLASYRKEKRLITIDGNQTAAKVANSINKAIRSC